MGAKATRVRIRKLRHWKQRFDKNAEFICRKVIVWDDGKTYQPGDPIPEGLKDNLTKLRRFWESQTVELAEFEDPDVATGQVTEYETEAEGADSPEPPDGVSVAKGKGTWYIVTTPDGDMKVNGQKALDVLLETLRQKVAETADDDSWLE